MSTITRAFTTRRLKSSVDLRDNDGFPHRSNTTKAAVGSIRHKISAPVELIHTTNMLSYNAPDLFPKAPSSATSSKSDSDSDTAPTTASTPPTSPDTPFPEKRSESPEPNHLSCYFAAPKHQSAAAPAASPEAPAIPQRAPSHTKKSYEGLVRHRSASRLSEQSTRTVSTKSSFTFSRSSSSSTSTSTTSVSHTSASHMQKPSMASLSSPPPPPPPAAPPVSHSRDLHKKDYSESHPFGHELAQVSELAEEYGIKDKLNPMEQEEQELLQKGLKKFSAEDYLSEVRSLTSMFFAEAARPLAAVWI